MVILVVSTEYLFSPGPHKSFSDFMKRDDDPLPFDDLWH